MSASRTNLAVALRWYVALLLFLAPLKFGGVIGLADDPFFPMDGWQWAFFVWPPFLAAFLAGVASVLALAAHPGPVVGRGRWLVVAWSVLAFAALLGLVRTTEWEYALPLVCHLSSAAVLAAAVRRMLAHDPASRRYLLAALSAAVLWCCIKGVQQRFGGLEQMRVTAREEAAQKGQTLANELSDKLAQTRVYGSFQIANLYAAHLILVAPLLLVVLWRAGRRFEPARLSQPLLVGLGALVFLGSLYWSGSRGAVLGLAAGLGLGGLAWPGLRRWRLPVALTALLLGVALVFVVGRERNLLSASARMQYYRSAWTMFREAPILGVGLGEFYPYHLRLRPLGAEPTRMPHNMPLGLLAQAGILAGLAALACLLLPAWLAFSRREENAPSASWPERLAVIVGLGAWSAHAVLDLNIQVPGTVLTAACLPLLILGDRCGESGDTARTWHGQAGGAALLLLTAFSLLGIWRFPGEYRFQQLGDAIQNGEPLLTIQERGQAAARWLPTSPNPDRALGRIAELTHNPGGAVDAYERAVRRAPHRAGLWGQLARARILGGDLPGAAAAAAIALEWNPGHAKYQAYQALIRGLRLGAGSPTDWKALVPTALSAEYHLDDGSGTDAMIVRISWPGESPPPFSLPSLAAWLAPHAGVFPPAGLPVRFQSDPMWTNGE